MRIHAANKRKMEFLASECDEEMHSEDISIILFRKKCSLGVYDRNKLLKQGRFNDMGGDIWNREYKCICMATGKKN
jgi:hypothetical protein